MSSATEQHHPADRAARPGRSLTSRIRPTMRHRRAWLPTFVAYAMATTFSVGGVLRLIGGGKALPRYVAAG
jgi:hypothetical protein